MHDRDVAHQADVDVMRSEIANRDRLRGQLEEPLAIDERSVGHRAQEVVGEDLVEALDVAFLHRRDVVGVETRQHLEVVFGLELWSSIAPPSSANAARSTNAASGNHFCIWFPPGSRRSIVRILP